MLGTGGLGCSVSMGLARLGVKKIVMVDKDVVDITNLNRQILFKLSDVGLPKAQTARERLIEQHVVSDKTQVEAHHMDVLPNWQ